MRWEMSLDPLTKIRVPGIVRRRETTCDACLNHVSSTAAQSFCKPRQRRTGDPSPYGIDQTADEAPSSSPFCASSAAYSRCSGVSSRSAPWRSASTDDSLPLARELDPHGPAHVRPLVHACRGTRLQEWLRTHSYRPRAPPAVPRRDPNGWRSMWARRTPGRAGRMQAR